MDVDDARETAGDNDNMEEITAEPSEEAEGTVEQVRAALGSGLNRRTFLAAAALGTAAAALVNRVGPGLSGIRLGPLPAFANDLSGLPCTAGDVEVVGEAVVANEPCSLTSGQTTFDAQVVMTVRNNTSTGRYCIALHLVASGGIAGQDVILRDASGSSTAPGKSGGESFHDTTMTGTITGFPVNAGVVCFGSPGVTRGKCNPGTCTTIAWSTSPGQASCTTADQSPPGGQCRHQQICVVGFGATLTCVSGCTPTCGAVATLQACVTAANNQLPITLSFSDSSGGTYTPTTITALTTAPGAPGGTACVTQTVTVTTTTTYTATFTDKNGCVRTATTVLSATPLPTPTISVTGPDCSGVATITASSSGATTFTFLEGTTTLGSNGSGTLTATFATGTHTVTVVAANAAGCTASATTTIVVNPPVTISLTTPTASTCAALGSSSLTFTATPSGGNGTYTVIWSVDGTVVQTHTGVTTSDTFAYGVNLDAGCHTVSVTAADTTANHCASAPASTTVKQCVNTSFGCT